MISTFLKAISNFDIAKKYYLLIFGYFSFFNHNTGHFYMLQLLSSMD